MLSILSKRQVIPNPPALTGNVITNPYAIDNASWNASGNLTVSANSLLAPDGSATADKAIPSITSGFHALSQTTLTTSAVGWIARARLKFGGYRYAELLIGNSVGYTKFLAFTFDVKAGKMVRKRGTTYDGFGRCRHLSDGWVLCDVVVNLADANSTHRVDIAYGPVTPVGSFVGDTISYIGTWGVEFAPN